MEFELGITDNPPCSWGKAEPLWQDEKIIATSSHTFINLMHEICENAIKLRREVEDDHGIDEHLWKLEIMSYRSATSPQGHEELFINRFMGGGEGSDSDSDEEDNESDTEEESYRRIIVIEQAMETDDGFFDDELYERMSPDEKISKENLPQNSVIKVTYDYGSTTTLYLKVLTVRHAAVRALVEYFNLESSMSDSKQQKELMDVPAHALPKEQQIDYFYPHISKIFMGKYVPVLTTLKENENVIRSFGDAHGSCENRISCASIGKYACIRSEEDTPFSFISGRMDSDVMFCPVVMEPNEFLQVDSI